MADAINQYRDASYQLANLVAEWSFLQSGRHTRGLNFLLAMGASTGSPPTSSS